MSVEKLTKKRLIQILVMLVILVSAFLYRSCHYQPQSANTETIEENSR
ncbi:hypothetical protein [Gallibacterium genomosp. 1]|nr:hypothetical protein [Gallibacterium genomosp. 1]